MYIPASLRGVNINPNGCWIFLCRQSEYVKSYVKLIIYLIHLVVTWYINLSDLRLSTNLLVIFKIVNFFFQSFYFFFQFFVITFNSYGCSILSCYVNEKTKVSDLFSVIKIQLYFAFGTHTNWSAYMYKCLPWAAFSFFCSLAIFFSISFISFSISAMSLSFLFTSACKAYRHTIITFLTCLTCIWVNDSIGKAKDLLSYCTKLQIEKLHSAFNKHNRHLVNNYT